MDDAPWSALARILDDMGLGAPLPRLGQAEGPVRSVCKANHLDETEVTIRLAERLGVPFIDLDRPEEAARFRVASFSGRVDPDFCWSKRVIPLFEDPAGITVAFANPLDHETRKLFEFSFMKPVRPVIAEEHKITKLLADYLRPDKLSFDALEDIPETEPVEIVGLLDKDENLDSIDANTPPIVRLCNKILADAVRCDASDVHIEPTQRGVDVRFRVDGIMQNIMEIPKRLQGYVLSRLKLLSGMDIAERRRPQDGRLRVRLAGQLTDMRVSSVPAAFGEKLVFRLLRSEGQDLSLASLGVPDGIRGALVRVLARGERLLLVTGPTGSGKTTTIYCCLDHLADGTRNIETVEDPIEYRIPGIHQIQVNESTNVTFSSTLRSILRQDPDVIMIGEIRDTETAQIALQAAQTGHLVLSTLHTNDAVSTISRLGHLGIEPYMQGSGLGGILAQRLVRKICSACVGSATPEFLARHAALAQRYGLELHSLRQGLGCPKCNFSGYKGRVGIFSFLEVTPSLGDLIAAQAPAAIILEEARRNGFVDLEEAALRTLGDELTTLEEIRPYLLREALSREQHTGTHKAPPVTDEIAPVMSATIDGGMGSEPDPGARRASISRQKALIIEDDEDVRKIFVYLLEAEMFDVIEAGNGLDGLKRVYEHNPDIVLCDLMMPVMDGKEFLKKMRNNRQTREIPVIILTAIDTEQNEVALMDIGAHDFISKSSSSGVILSRIRSVLQRT